METAEQKMIRWIQQISAIDNQIEELQARMQELKAEKRGLMTVLQRLAMQPELPL
jgi:prefoldin subunit 5